MLKKVVLVTGSAGFIGFHLSKKLLEMDFKVLGLDGFTDYSDVNLKNNRDTILRSYHNFTSINCILENKSKVLEFCTRYKPNIIIHLAAQAGVRYSITNPKTYFDSNLLGTFNILEIAKILNIDHLMIASTSSVYGAVMLYLFQKNKKLMNHYLFTQLQKSV